MPPMPIHFACAVCGRPSAIANHCARCAGASRGGWPRTPHPDASIFRHLIGIASAVGSARIDPGSDRGFPRQRSPRNALSRHD